MAKASVIIVAGGSGSRMGGGTKKEFLDIEGKPVLFRALDPFLKCGLFDSAVIVIKEGLEDEAEKLITPFLTPKQKDTVRCVTGGRTRQESVLKGLLALKDESPDIVLIHDGARPWITEKIITDVYNKVVTEGAAIPVVPSVNALKEIDGRGKIIRNIDRDRIAGAQTPQGFRYRGISRPTSGYPGRNPTLLTTRRYSLFQEERFTPYRETYGTKRLPTGKI